PGTPSPEALARLQAAVNKQPAPAAAAPRAAMAASRPAAPAAAPAEKPRFGINSLINRMTGHAEGGAAPHPQQPPVSAAPRAAAPQHSAYEDEADLEQDRIEIPAFLRRQAN
ncbi:MAG: cell division protein FtsZ, partial [Sphingomonadales bacterium]|nr:cell division protein FtsZ [Sphingomonadales bacterium]